jgi:hypothetical protein
MFLIPELIPANPAKVISDAIGDAWSPSTLTHPEVTMTASSDESLLLPREVAAMLRLKVNSVYAAAAAGRLPAVRLWRGRRKSLLRFKRRDIEDLIRRGAASS